MCGCGEETLPSIVNLQTYMPYNSFYRTHYLFDQTTQNKHTNKQSIIARAPRRPPPMTMTLPSATPPLPPPRLPLLLLPRKKNRSAPKSSTPTPKQPMPPPPSSHCGRFSSRPSRSKSHRHLISSPPNTLPRHWRH